MRHKEEIVRSKGYWIADLQFKIFDEINQYLKENKMTQTEFAEKLGFSKGYISQIMNAEADHKMSKIIELMLAIDKVPQFDFIPVNEYLNSVLINKEGTNASLTINYSRNESTFEVGGKSSKLMKTNLRTSELPLSNRHAVRAIDSKGKSAHLSLVG